jgi:hypothetical protein
MKAVADGVRGVHACSRWPFSKGGCFPRGRKAHAEEHCPPFVARRFALPDATALPFDPSPGACLCCKTSTSTSIRMKDSTMPTAGLPGRYAARARPIPLPIGSELASRFQGVLDRPIRERTDCFDGPAGLPCVLQFEYLEGVSLNARAIVMLGLRLADLQERELGRVLTLQARYLARGAWYLGAGADGELRLLSLLPSAAAQDMAGAIDAASLIAMSILRQVIDPSAGPGLD